ncbi:peptidase M75, partial [cyanobacterium TDX16]
MKVRFVAGLLALVAVLGLAACSDDDGEEVRDTDTSTESESASASGISEEGLVPETDDELVNEAIESYRAYVIEQVDQIVVEAQVFTDAVRSGDVEAAQEAYAPSRQSWERIEPVAGLVEEIDGAVDARVDDFEDEQDPDFTGWHRLEHLVFDQETTEGAEELADQLDADLATLQE